MQPEKTKRLRDGALKRYKKLYIERLRADNGVINDDFRKAFARMINFRQLLLDVFCYSESEIRKTEEKVFLEFMKER